MGSRCQITTVSDRPSSIQIFRVFDEDTSLTLNGGRTAEHHHNLSNLEDSSSTLGSALYRIKILDRIRTVDSSTKQSIVAVCPPFVGFGSYHNVALTLEHSFESSQTTDKLIEMEGMIYF